MTMKFNFKPHMEWSEYKEPPTRGDVEEQFEEALRKLHGNSYLLTREEELAIIEIAKSL